MPHAEEFLLPALESLSIKILDTVQISSLRCCGALLTAFTIESWIEAKRPGGNVGFGLGTGLFGQG